MISALNWRGNLQAFRELVVLLTRHRRLTLEMARRETMDRYSGQFFGLFWTLVHPLTLIFVYVFIFGLVFQTRVGGTRELPFDYTTYLLAGLIPWIAFNESMGKASGVIVANANLVKQVIFPIEVLPIKGVLATLFTMTIFWLLFLVYVLVAHGFVFWSYLLLPGLILTQVIAMIGVSYALAAIGAYFRDIKDFVQVFATLGFWLIPVVYLPESVPSTLRWVLYLNPFSYMVWCYQDALYFGRFAHPYAWIVFGVMSLGVFVIGYRLFRKLKMMFGNVL